LSDHHHDARDHFVSIVMVDFSLKCSSGAVIPSPGQLSCDENDD
jgi:hypothetical protein